MADYKRTSRASRNRTKRRTRERSARCRVEPLEDRRLLANFSLLKDINTLVPGGSEPEFTVEVGSTAFFAATTLTSGRELWKSDGTAAGTVLVKDIWAGVGSSSPANLINVGGILFFTADDGTGDYPSTNVELWRSDGTPAGTYLLKDLVDGGDAYPNYLTNVNGVLYFAARGPGGNNGPELWKTDGTEAGTVRVSDLNPGPLGSYPQSLVNVGGTLYYSANDGSNGRELWRTTAGPAGVELVADIRPFFPSSNPQRLTNVGGVVYFTANDGFNGVELWKSDGTAAGTVLVQDVNPGAADASITDLANSGGILFFANGPTLWRSTGMGAAQVGSGGTPRELTDVNGTLFYTVTSGSSTELWRIQGNAPAPSRVNGFQSGAILYYSHGLTNLNGTLYLRSTNANPALWKVPPAATTATKVSEVDPGVWKEYDFLGRRPGAGFANINGTLFFPGNNGASGIELWKTDGTNAGTVRIKDINGGTQSSAPQNLTNVGGVLYFTANDGALGTELWKSDGSGLGTVNVRDIRPGAPSSEPTTLTNVAGTLYFTANDATYGDTLWKSNGTPQGTLLFLDPATDFAAVGNTLFFSRQGAGGAELWKSDGTGPGTVRVKDLRPGSEGSFPQSFVEINGIVYFAANDGTLGFEVWRTDGTEVGTYIISDVNPQVGGVGIDHLTNVNGDLVFATAGDALWRTNGTPFNVVSLGDPSPGESRALYELEVAGGTLYFRAYNAAFGYELWRTTNAGITLVMDINPGAASAFGPNARAPLSSTTLSQALTAVGDTLYFFANDGAHGIELWKTDGTPVGTGQVADIGTGPLGSSPANGANVEGVFYFSASDGVRGQELWRVESGVGAIFVQDIFPGPGGSNPASMTAVGDRLYFVATSEAFGREILFAPTMYGPLAGDYDDDNDVDGADFLLWQRTLGQPATPAGSGADGDFNGTIDDADLQLWTESFGDSSQGSGAAATPAVAAAVHASALDAIFAAGDFTRLGATTRTRGPAPRTTLTNLSVRPISTASARIDTSVRGREEASGRPMIRPAAASHARFTFPSLAESGLGVPTDG